MQPEPIHAPVREIIGILRRDEPVVFPCPRVINTKSPNVKSDLGILWSQTKIFLGLSVCSRVRIQTMEIRPRRDFVDISFAAGFGISLVVAIDLLYTVLHLIIKPW
jgi:hypothetical protein